MKKVYVFTTKEQYEQGKAFEKIDNVFEVRVTPVSGVVTITTSDATEIVFLPHSIFAYVVEEVEEQEEDQHNDEAT